MIELIQNNPFRILGVYSNSSQKEIVANLGKMKAFLKVGRQVSFPLDLNDLLPTISRSEQSVAEASSKLALPIEQLRYAQFWFFKSNQIDEIACGRLINGDIDGAVEIWSKKNTISTLQNRIVCSLIKGQLANAINYAETLYSSYGEDFVAMVLGDNAIVTSDNLVHDFLNIICEEYSSNEILNCITNTDWKEYVESKSIKPLIDKISSAIDLANTSKDKGPAARLKAGTKLMNDTKKDLKQLKQFVSSSDLKYQMIADKLGLAILQCGIDYYNDSTEPEAARKAMELQGYAKSIVVGKMAKDRCKENVNILNNIIKELPPAEVFSEDSAIKEELQKFSKLPDKICYSVNLLKNTKPYLQTIKSKLGATNDYYLKISTKVVASALNNVIEEVNALQNSELFKMSIVLNKAEVLSLLKSTLRSAWEAISIMDSFDMESDYKANIYNKNHEILSDMCEKLDVSTNNYSTSSSIYIDLSSTLDSYKSNSSSSSSKDDNDWGCLPWIIAVIISIIAVILSNM